MRWSAFLAVCLFVLLPLAPVSSAQAPEPITVLTDEAGDLRFGSGGAVQVAGSVAMPSERYPALDLLGVDVQEMAETILMTLRVADLDPPQEVFIADDVVYYVTFDHNDQRYAVQMNRVRADQYYAWGALFKAVEDGQSFNFVRQLDVEHDADADELRVMLLREDLLDLDGAAPFPGRSIDDFVALAHLRSNEGFGTINGNPIATPYDAWDIVPDDGTPDGAMPVTLGLEQSGHAELITAAPMRASNGEATTFVYTMTARNTGDEEDLFLIEARGTPRAWQVVIPDRAVTLGPGESVDLPVLVSTPFAHRHGAVETFLVEMRSQSDPGSIGRTELGIRYHAIPQPAGHHDTVWLHSQRFGEDTALFVVTDNLFAGNSGFATMNTLEQDPEDQGVPIKGQFNGLSAEAVGEPVRARWNWWVFLQPGLEMGLDFDLQGAGTLSVPFESGTPLVQAVASGRLLHFAYDEDLGQWIQTVVAQLEPSAPVDLSPNQEETFTWQITIEEEADRLEYARRAALAIQLNMSTVRPALFTGVEAPELMPGGVMQLPLFEYADPVDDIFASIGQVMFHALGPQQKMTNPGETSVMAVELANHRGQQTTFDLELAGVNVEWAALMAPERVTLSADGTQDVTLAVSVPSDARDGDKADIILTAQAVDDPTVRTIVRLVAEVDTDADHPDEAHILDSLSTDSEATPGPGLLLLLAAIAFAGRRRD